MFVLDHATSARYRPDGQPSWTWASPRVVEAVAKMGLKHCVITSNRDELVDGGISLGRYRAAIRNRTNRSRSY